jgi:predicted dehydrogenase
MIPRGGNIMADTLRWGILATGWIAEQFTRDLQLTGRPVVAVGSRSQKAAERFAARFGIPRTHASYADLAADPEVDIVYVATPHPMHAANAIMALEAGKHVLVEKAFTINAAEAQRVVDAADRHGRVVLEAMWTRFLPHMVRVREILASGQLGDIISLVADHTQDLPDDPGHRLNDLALGGGALLDLGIYPISLAWDVLGEPTRIEAMARFKPTGADAEVATLFRHRNGAISTTLSASDAAGPNTASIIGTKGRIDIGQVWYLPANLRVYDSEHRLVEEYVSNVAGRGMQYQAAEIEHLIRTGQSAGTILPPTETVAIMQTLDTIREKIGLRYPGE